MAGDAGELSVGGGERLVGVVAIVFAVLFVLVVVFIVVTAVKRYRAAKAAGLDPFAADVQLLGAAAGSAMLAPHRTTAERLAELDALQRAGTITAAERDAARARILGP